MRNMIFSKLARSKFRSKIHLEQKDLEKARKIIKNDKDKLREDCIDILNKRIRKLQANDGKQTAWKGHPIFTAQHATAICCRQCIAKWYKIPKTRDLKEGEINFLADIIMEWIDNEMRKIY